MFRDLSPSVLNFYSKGGSLKLSFTLSYVLKRANDNSDFKLTRFAFEFEAVPREQTSFPNPSGTEGRTEEGYNKYLIYLVFSVRTVSYGSSCFPRRVMVSALRA